METLQKFITDNNLTSVTGKIFSLPKDAGYSVRVKHNTKDGLPIFLKYFHQGKNIIISVGNTEKNSFYINQTDKDGVVNPVFEQSIKNFASKKASLVDERISTAIEV